MQSEIDINIYKKRFLIYKELIGVNDSYSDFSNYYYNRMTEIESNYEKILTKKFQTLKNFKSFV